MANFRPLKIAGVIVAIASPITYAAYASIKFAPGPLGAGFLPHLVRQDDLTYEGMGGGLYTRWVYSVPGSPDEVSAQLKNDLGSTVTWTSKGNATGRGYTCVSVAEAGGSGWEQNGDFLVFDRKVPVAVARGEVHIVVIVPKPTRPFEDFLHRFF